MVFVIIKEEGTPLTVEEDILMVIQAAIIVILPILMNSTVKLWQGCLEGGLARYQAGIIFLSDPLTIVCVVIGMGALISFCVLTIVQRRVEKINIPRY